MPRPASRSSKKQIAILYLVLAMIIWGAAGPIIKFTLQYVPPFTFLFLRFLIATAIVAPAIWYEEKRNPIDKRDLKSLILLSFIGGTLNLSFVFLGFKYTTALDGTLLSAISPIFIILASSKLLREKVTKNEEKGALIALGGALLITLQPFLELGAGTFNLGFSRFMGNVLMILGVLSWTLYTIWSRKILGHVPSKIGGALHYLHLRPTKKNYSPFFLTGLLCVVSLTTLAPVAFWEIVQIKGLRKDVSLSNPGMIEQGLKDTYRIPKFDLEFAPALAGILYMGIMSTLVAYGMYEWAIREIPAAESAIFAYLSPIFAVPVANFLLGEKITPMFILGAAIIGYGIYVSELKTQKR